MKLPMICAVIAFALVPLAMGIAQEQCNGMEGSTPDSMSFMRDDRYVEDLTEETVLLQTLDRQKKIFKLKAKEQEKIEKNREDQQAASHVQLENTLLKMTSNNGDTKNNDVSSAVISEGNMSLSWRWRRGCAGKGKFCLWDSHCCGSMECLGIVNWQCGNTPGLDGEYCNTFYPCAEHLLCHHGKCTDYKKVLLRGTKGTCMAGNSPGTLKVMTYNIFLINCLNKKKSIFLTCQPEKDQRVRIRKLMEWFKERDEDVVVFQELFNLRDEVIDGMAAAGFCHYVATPFGTTGSGLATFSKHPIKTIDFIDWFDWTGKDSDKLLDPEVIADKGVMYAKIEKDRENYHVFNTHTQSNSLREHHDTRLGQYLKMKEFAENVIGTTSTELIVFGGDFNENKYKKGNKQRFYKEMLDVLHAFEPEIKGKMQYTLDTSDNPMLANLWKGTATETFSELLDYVLVSTRGKQPHKSRCEVLKPQWPYSCGKAECMLSDHFPNTCTFEG